MPKCEPSALSLIVFGHLRKWAKSVSSIRKRRTLEHRRRRYATDLAYRTAAILNSVRVSISDAGKQRKRLDNAKESNRAKRREWYWRNREGQKVLSRAAYERRKSFAALNKLLNVDENTPIHSSVRRKIK